MAHEPSSGVGLSRYLSRRLLPSTLAIGALLSITLPFTYYLFETAKMKQAADIYAKEIANAIVVIVGESPVLWKYQVQKYLKMIYSYTPNKDIDHVHVFDERGRLISEHLLGGGRETPSDDWKATTGRAAVVFNNRPIGTVEVCLLRIAIIRRTFLIFLFSLISGSGLAYFTYAFPLRVARDGDKAIRAAQGELELKVEERTRELAAANEALTLENEERKRAEAQLLEAQQDLIRKEKLSILGQLAGIVGHELRNPLGVMSNAVYFLKTVVPDSDATIREYLDIIKNEIDNSLRIISDLLDFSRTKTPEAKAVAVNELISRILGRCVVPAGVTVSVDIPETLPQVKTDPFQIGQVLQNLFTNAIQAMPNGGSLRIAARPFPAPPSLDKGRPEDAEDRVEISVTDTGAGIAPENMGKLFQPLYTTKRKGVGLGLTVCKTLTEANGGAIRAESAFGTGTTFSVFLPKAG